MSGETIFIIGALVLVAGLIVQAVAVMLAPVGYQDDTGFHLGTKQPPEGV